MQTRVQKWGNSLAVRIPKSLAAQLSIGSESVVDVAVQDGKLVLLPVLRPAYSLHEMLEQVTSDNLHGEIDSGPSVGREIW